MKRLLILFVTYIIAVQGALYCLEAKEAPFVVVIDAGHGGKDPGARRGAVMEKNITLGVALRLGELIKSNHKNIKVLYTRSTDKFVGLQQRADFANKHHASLFLSIHVNSASGAVSGTETYVLGLDKHKNNLNVALRENKVMELEDNYKTIYRGYNPNSSESLIAFKLMQEAYQERSIQLAKLIETQYRCAGRVSRGVRQAPFWVLSQSAMPSILTEIGFLSNPKEANFLNSQEGQSTIARALYQAVREFYLGAGVNQAPYTEVVDIELPETDIDTTAGETVASEPSVQAPALQAQPNKAERTVTSSKGVRYRVQFMSVSQKIDTQDKSFKRLKVPIYRAKHDKTYRYLAGDAKTIAEARQLRKRIGKYYKDAFIVGYDKSGRYLGRIE